MKKQDAVVFITALVMMISCAALSFGQELTFDKDNLKEYQSQYEKILDIGFIGEDIKSFGPALESGNLKAVKYLAETYPGLNLLTTPLIPKDGIKDNPICIVSAAGHNNIIEYMLEKFPKLANKKCGGYDENYPITKAVNNGHVDTAEYLLSKDAKPTEDMFIRTAKFGKEESQLKTFIPKLLNAKIKPSYQVNRYWPKWGEIEDEMDSFFFAAMNKNEAFISVLSDELKRRGEDPVSLYTFVSCPDYHSEAWGISKEWLIKQREQNIQRIKDSNASKLLEKYGVKVIVDVQFVDSIDCE